MRPKTRLNFRHFSEGARNGIFGATWVSRPPIWTKNRRFLSKNCIKNYCRTCAFFCFDFLANFGCFFGFVLFFLFCAIFEKCGSEHGFYSVFCASSLCGEVVFSEFSAQFAFRFFFDFSYKFCTKIDEKSIKNWSSKASFLCSMF